ncbi:class I SAM-dependent methyltransferase [Algoriphagus hitonicola]|uniref:Thiopurine S-methyltransferase (TPMT) n=1 Tax=Algoriphagus hitonicola TaxID=435880 RepID=A0A1I2NE09_9BACT|nr:SAM-dependent methyltransferase [Algoriphagus hitonicola]SFG01788.1 Thiopurine S-methyltransferase (TPMT) [Algoriphagus hitonicola]
MINLNENYWTERYRNGYTGWDIGHASPPLMQYLDQIADRNLRVLIPGAGNGYEAVAGYRQGFVDIHLLDISRFPLERFAEQFSEFPENQIHHEDFFDHQGEYDLILEQTFFCALDPSLRVDYCKKMRELLKPQGKLVGVLFGIEFERSGPPFGGNMEDYRELFEDYFGIKKLEPCYNSIPPRAGTEVFIHLINQ